MKITYKHFLYGALIFVSLLAAILKIGYVNTPGRGPVEFNWGILYFAFVALVAGQLWKIHSREREQAEPGSSEDAGQPLSAEDPPSEETLRAAETYLSLGESLETVCRFVNPKYQDWDRSRREAYRRGLGAILEARRMKSTGSAPETDTWINTSS